jgi:hypothetical protein
MILNKYLIPLFNVADAPAGATDGPAADPVAAPDPATAPAAPAAGDPPAPVLAPRPVDPRTLIGQISEQREKRRAAEERAERAEREANEARQLLARLQQSAPPAAPGATPPIPPAQPSYTPPEPAQPDHAEIDRLATEKVVMRDLQGVSQAGAAKFGPAWNDTIAALNAYGVNTIDFVAGVMEVDRSRAHEIMHDIAQDGELAIQLAQMSPVQRIARITRMAAAAESKTKSDSTAAAAAAAPAPKVSKAPAPAPAIDPGTTKTVDWRSDSASDEEFSRGWNENMKTRVARR